MARAARPHRGAALQDPARDRRPEPALADGRRTDERRRLRGRLVRRRRRPGASTTASLPPGATRTCASSPRTSSRRCSWCTCGRRSGHRYSRPTAIPSATGAGCSCTTATSVTSRSSGGTSCGRSIRSCSPGSWGSTDTEVVFRLALTFGLEEDPIGALERTVGLIEATATRARRRADGAGRPSASRTAAACGPCGTRPKAGAVPLRVGRRRLAAPPVPRQENVVPTATPDDRLIASEPFSDLPGVWHEIDESSAVIVRSGGVLEHRPFEPAA